MTSEKVEIYRAHSTSLAIGFIGKNVNFKPQPFLKPKVLTLVDTKLRSGQYHP